MQCELKLAKAGLLAMTKKEYVQMLITGSIGGVITLLCSSVISYFYGYDFVKIYWTITLLIALPLLFIAFVGIYRICHNPILLQKNIEDIKKAIQMKQ